MLLFSSSYVEFQMVFPSSVMNSLTRFAVEKLTRLPIDERRLLIFKLEVKVIVGSAPSFPISYSGRNT